MLGLLTRLQAFLFSPISARGFGLMRVMWSTVALAFFLMQSQDIIEFYSDAGVLPTDLAPLIMRSLYRFSLFDIVTSPEGVLALYGLLLLSLFCAMIGLLPRIATILSFVLMASFHERNTLILGGGDTVLRTIGFILCIAPTLSAFSVMRLRQQWKHWKKTRQMLPDLVMSIWAYRLLLWQLIIIYGMSVWLKLMGTMWEQGTATTAALQHEIFARWPREIMELVIFTAPFATFFALAFESVWVLLLFPRSFTRWALNWEFQPCLKRYLIFIGLIFHGGILITMDVGVFSLAMFTMYAGLLLGEDFEAIRTALNRRFKAPIRIFYDSHCGLCLRSMFALQVLDHLKRLAYVDFRNEAERRTYAPDLRLEDLDAALHIRFADGRTLNGFDAFRALSWHLPTLWILAPLLYLPGVPPVGRKVYASVAERRKSCRHEDCGFGASKES
jgi:predicted DCC family thiol-disulfide oxidoreductase YuxK